MKKRLLFLNCIFTILLFTFSCSKDNISQKKDDICQVKIFGTDMCGYTNALKNDCTNAKINFTYVDINLNNENNYELGKIAKNYNLGSSIGVNSIQLKLPVVFMKKGNDSTGLERPNIETIKQFISK